MMNNSANADIRNLFQKFGGDTRNYQEIQQEYVSDKAQQSWPIVKAMEKAHSGESMLKAASAVRNTSTVASRPELSVASSKAAIGKSIAPVAKSERKATGERDATLLSVLNKSAPTPLVVDTPVRSLFGALTASVKSSEMNMQSQDKLAANPVQVRRSQNDPLNSVFSRLLNPQNSVHAGPPEKNLRSMLGFLNK